MSRTHAVDALLRAMPREGALLEAATVLNVSGEGTDTRVTVNWEGTQISNVPAIGNGVLVGDQVWMLRSGSTIIALIGGQAIPPSLTLKGSVADMDELLALPGPHEHGDGWILRDTGHIWVWIDPPGEFQDGGPFATTDHAALSNILPDDHHDKDHAHDGLDGSGTIAHASTTGRGSDDHHPQAHVHDGIDGSGEVSHDDLLDVSADQHHPQTHTHSGDGSGDISHDNLTDVSPDDHHPQTHVLYGPDHSDVDESTPLETRHVLAIPDGTPDWIAETRMNWRGAYVGGTHFIDDVVRDGNYVMVANKETEDRPAPQPVGQEFNLYTGADPTTPITAKTVSFGTEFTFNEGGFIKGYRVYTVTGNEYRIFLINEQGELVELLSMTAGDTGWQDLALETTVGTGAHFALLVHVSEPDPSPTVWTGVWDYDTPNSPATPASGQIVHSNQTSGTLRIHNTDDLGGDRTAELLALTPGDIIEGPGGQRWSIADSKPFGTYVEFGVAPSQQDSPDGAGTFSFETVAATPITVLADVDYWLTSPFAGLAKGLYSIDGAPWVENDTAYGVDLVVQQAYVSPDWDLLALMGTGGSGDSGGGGPHDHSHSDLTNVQADQHHDELHDLDSHTNVQAAAPPDGHRLAFDEALNAWVPKQSTSALGMVAFHYRYSTSTDGTPGAGYAQVDTADPALATVLHIHKENDDGSDITLFLENVETGVWINLYDNDDADRHHAYDVTGTPTLVGDVFHVPVTLYEVLGVPLSNNLKIDLLLRFGTSGSHDSLTGVTPDQHHVRYSDAESVAAGELHGFWDRSGLEEGTPGGGDQQIPVWDVTNSKWVALPQAASLRIMGSVADHDSLPPGPHNHGQAWFTNDSGDLWMWSTDEDPDAFVNIGPFGSTDHQALTDVRPDDHHDQQHFHDGLDGSGVVDHTNLIGIGTDDHHVRYTDAEAIAAVDDGTYLKLTGGKMTGHIDMSSGQLQDVNDIFGRDSDGALNLRDGATTRVYIATGVYLGLYGPGGGSPVVRVNNDSLEVYQELNMQSKRISSVLNPSLSQDAATKAYVDSEIGNIPGAPPQTYLHEDLTDVGPDQHHARDHAATHVAGGADDISATFWDRIDLPPGTVEGGDRQVPIWSTAQGKWVTTGMAASLRIMGSVATENDLPAGPHEEGQAWTVNDTGDLWVWTAEGIFENAGPLITTQHDALTDVTSDQHHVRYSDQEAIDAVGGSLANYLPLAGGVMLGSIELNADPTAALHAATKQYVDSMDDRQHTVSESAPPAPNLGDVWVNPAFQPEGEYLPLDGSLPMAGELILSGDPISALGAVTKQYADNAGVTDHGALSGLGDNDHPQYSLTSHTHSYLPLSGGTMTGNIDMNNKGLIGASSVDPESNIANDLGTSALSWRRLYVHDIYDDSGALKIQVNSRILDGGTWIVDGALNPDDDLAHNLGSSSKSWRDIYSEEMFDKSGVLAMRWRDNSTTERKFVNEAGSTKFSLLGVNAKFWDELQGSGSQGSTGSSAHKAIVWNASGYALLRYTSSRLIKENVRTLRGDGATLADDEVTAGAALAQYGNLDLADKLLHLPVRMFDMTPHFWTSEDGIYDTDQPGFIADEMVALFGAKYVDHTKEIQVQTYDDPDPENDEPLIDYDHPRTIVSDEPMPSGWSERFIIPLLVEQVQRLNARIEELESHE